MKTGYSLLLREFVEAVEIEYGDCADFQITCPACHEAVFKSGNDQSERQYLSHYRNTESDVSECELRVAAMSKEHMAQKSSEGRNQLLETFQKRFMDETLEHITPADTEEFKARSSLKGIIEKYRERSSFKAMVRDMRIRLAKQIRTPEGMKAFLGDGSGYRNDPNNPENGGQSEIWIRRQFDYAEDFARHILAPGSLRTLYDATMIGMYKVRQTIMRRGIIGFDPEVIDYISETMTYGKDRQLASLTKAARREVIETPMGDMAVSAVVEQLLDKAISGALIEFPYVQAAMNENGQRIDETAHRPPMTEVWRQNIENMKEEFERLGLPMPGTMTNPDPEITN